MMDRLGFSFLYFAPHITTAHEPWFARLREHGYACAELPIVEATDQEIEWLRRTCEREGLARSCVGFALPGSSPIAADRAERDAAVAHLARLCEKAQALGADLVAGPMHSAYGVWTEQPPTGDERARCIEVLQRAGEHAARCGVRLAIEPLNRFESYFLNTAADCAALVRSVAHEHVVAALDTHHAHIEEVDIATAIRESADVLGHVQLSENHRGTPGTGQVKFDEVLACLDAVDYQGWLVVEAFSRQDPAFGSQLRIWRDLDAGPESVLAAGAALTHLLPRS
ncbi:MAG: sugar phosphate isomerase/epimerase family protein [Planctomycetota bacterium]